MQRSESTPNRAAFVLEGQRLQRQMNTPAGLRESAARLIEASHHLGCDVMVGASSAANSVIAVAVVLTDGAIRSVSAAEVAAGRIDRLIVVEGVAISGLKVRRAIQAARASGVEWIAAIVLHDVIERGGVATDSTLDRFGPLDNLYRPPLALSA